MYRKAIATLIILGFASAAHAQSMLECSKLDGEEARLECYDRVAGRVEEKLEEKQSGTSEERVEARNEAIAEAVVGTKVVEETVPDVLSFTIEKVMRDRARRVIYKTSEGRYFKRSSGSRITFREGDSCILDTGMMNSLFLVRDDGQKNKVEELNTK